MKHLLIAAALCAPTSLAAQPFSKSMAQCAALHQNAAQFVTSDDAANALVRVAQVWAEAALVQSRKEGKTVDIDTIWDVVDAQTETWEAKGSNFFMTEEFRDWTDYCRSFADNEGIEIPPA